MDIQIIIRRILSTGLRQAELAELLTSPGATVNQSSISHWAMGRRKHISYQRYQSALSLYRRLDRYHKFGVDRDALL